MADNTNDLPKINSQISMGLYPAILDVHREVLDADGARGQPAFHMAKAALGTMYEEIGRIQTARAAAFDTLSPTDARRLQMHKDGRGPVPPNVYMSKEGQLTLHLAPEIAASFNSASTIAFERGSVRLDQAHQKAMQTRAELVDIVEHHVVDPKASSASGIAMAQEIRAHLKSLPADQRAAWVRQKVEAGNTRVASAVQNAEPELAGLDDKAHAVLVDLMQVKFTPVERKQLDSINALVQAIEDAGTLALNAFERARVPEPAKSKAASSALSALRTGGGR
jgi:hypothetical protein